MVVRWLTISRSSRSSRSSVDGSCGGSFVVVGTGGTMVDSVGGGDEVGATSKILSANFAKVSLSRSSAVEAKMSWVCVGSRRRNSCFMMDGSS